MNILITAETARAFLIQMPLRVHRLKEDQPMIPMVDWRLIRYHTETHSIAKECPAVVQV
jgi:hypothetical protein